MMPSNYNDQTSGFSREQIMGQLEKILRDPHFGHSKILVSFLRFIVVESMEGRSNSLKEYTIAVNVLKRPKSFSAKEDCIVRIHAVRLRKALMDYYNAGGALDAIRISLPKGSYMPVFSDNLDDLLGSVSHNQSAPTDGRESDEHDVTTAVLPFYCHSTRKILADLSEGLGIQLCAALKKVGSLSVISYSISRRIPESFADLNGLRDLFHAQYVFTGGVQCQKNNIRINVEMIRSDTAEQVWSESFDRKITGFNNFRIQDEIINLVMSSLQRQHKLRLENRSAATILSVA